MMGDKKKILWILVKLACTALLTVQLAFVLGGFIKPAITRTWEEEVPLQDIDFPVVMKICVSPGFNQTALHEVGYEDTWHYFLGQSKFNSSVLRIVISRVCILILATWEIGPSKFT